MHKHPEVFTLDEVAELLRVSGPQVRRLVARGVIGHIKAGRYLRFTQVHIDAFLAGEVTRPAATPVTTIASVPKVDHSVWGRRKKQTA